MREVAGDDLETKSDEALAAVGKMIAKLVRSTAWEAEGPELALGEITETAAVALRVARASVWRLDETRTKLECLDLFERGPGRHSRGMLLSADATPRYFAALAEERTIAAGDACTDPRTSEFAMDYLTPNGIAAMLDAPIWLAGRTLGVVCHEHVGEPRMWTPWEELVAGTFADLVALVFGAIERKRQAQILDEYRGELEKRVVERTEQLGEEQRFLTTVFATAPVGMAFFDREARYTRINTFLTDLNGVPIEETIGRRPSEVLLDKSAGLAAEGLVRSVLETGQPTATYELSHAEEQRSFLVRAYPITTEAGVVNVGCSVIEITAQRENEREKAELLARERAAREEAEAASRAKDEFLAMLGHELRNPLAPIVTALHLMDDLGEAAAEERLVIARQVHHLNRLVDDLLDVARITRGKLTLRSEPIELVDAVTEGIELASPLLESRQHSLEVDVPETGVLVDADLDRLAQVVSNLLTNAAKFAPQRGRIRLSGRREGDRVVLAVRDNGIGIAPELLPKVFEAFVQGERRLDRSQGGLGLGLAIVRAIVLAHGGEISAHSEGVGYGSEFVVRLPAFVKRAAAPARATTAPVRTMQARKILVVDDNEDAARMLSRVLQAIGHETSTAFDGPTAVEVARAFYPQIALVDLGLPVMDGIELASHLRAVPGLEAIKLVAMTGYGRHNDFARTRQAGFHLHVVKPIEIDELRGILANLFGE